MDFFRDPIWQFISVIIAIIALIAPIFADRMQRNRKDLVYEIISNAPVLNNPEFVKNRVELLLDGSPVSDASLIILKLWNAGNISIQSRDFEEAPITFSFRDANGQDVEIINADILDTEPSSVKSRAFLTFIHGDLKLKPLLLNSKDSITFRILLARSFKEMDVDIRIADVKGIRKVDTTQNQVNGLHIIYLITALLSIGGLLETLPSKGVFYSIGAIVFLTGFFLFIIYCIFLFIDFKNFTEHK